MSEPTADQVQAFVAASHGDLAAVQTLLAAEPGLLHRAHPWSESDHETAIQAAAHVGNAAIAEFLLARGAALAIPTAAMLGRRADVDRLLAEDPARSREAGAHGIPLLAHAAFSGDAGLVGRLYQLGAQAGADMALAHAAQRGHTAVARWLLANARPNPGWRNWQGKTALELAEAAGQAEVAALLRSTPAA